MLILASLSGIQDYLFDVREIGGGQSQALRARSFQIQVISECIALRLLRALDLPPSRIVFRAAAKFAITTNATGEDIHLKLDPVLNNVHRWLRDHTQARLRLTVAVSCMEGTDVDQYSDAQQRLSRDKLNLWGGVSSDGRGWAADQLVVPELLDQDAQAKRDEEIGRALVRARRLHFVEPIEEAAFPHVVADQVEFDAVGLRVQLGNADGVIMNALHSEPIDRFAFHVPTDAYGHTVEFVELAMRACGAPMLGVLKADVDSLGQAIGGRLRGASDLQPLYSLSTKLNNFFGKALNSEMHGGAPSSRNWANMYTVFSGGDDVLLVGPWDVTLDFAGHLHHLFRQCIGEREGLTFSAGLAIVKPKFPIRLAARQAEEFLERAKTNLAAGANTPKDQFCALDGLWKWENHEQIVTASKKLVQWVDAGVIQRGYLHTLLELALLRRGRALARPIGAPAAMATARLAYHVARNWPKRDDRDDRKRAARAWVDAILHEFDRYETSSHVETIHLPAIVRYATLATRAGEREERP